MRKMMHIVSSKFKGQNNDKEHETIYSSSVADNRRVYGVVESRDICRNYANDETCSYGNNCRYLHEEGFDVPKKPGVCFSFENHGKCSRLGCKFSHGDEKQKVPIIKTKKQKKED